MYILLKTKNRAVTLFEMLLVLFVSSMIILAGFKYEQTQKEAAVATALANDMYIFSQTVRKFVVDNKDALLAGTYAPNPAVLAPSSFTESGTAPNKVYVFTGVQWLTDPARTMPNSTNPYLKSTFSFNGLAPLRLQRGNLIGDEAVEVTITGADITIVYGALYDARDTTKAPILKGGITANAARKASTMADPLMGPSVFDYVGGIDAQGNAAPITATLLPSTSMDTQLANPTIAGGLDLGGDTSETPESGGIKNVEDITFNESVPGKVSDISGVDIITFSMAGPGGAVENVNAVNFQNTNGGPSTIKNLNTLIFDNSISSTNNITNVTNVNFKPGATTQINNLTTLNFETAGGDLTSVKTIGFVNGGKINNIDTINFGSTGSGKLTGVNSIQFKGGTKFVGFDASPVGMIKHFDPSNTERSGNYVFVTDYKLSEYLCVLSFSRFNDGGSDANKGCQVIAGWPNFEKYSLSSQGMQTCGMTCWKFAEP